MHGDAELWQRLADLVQQVRVGQLPRREFLRRVGLIGLSSTAAATMLGMVRAAEAAAESPSQAAPPQTPIQGRNEAGGYRWGAVQPAVGGPGVYFWLRSAHEGSPKILTRGWPMTAYVRAELPGVRGDLASIIRWEGSGTFARGAGQAWVPSFARAGRNFVKLVLRVQEREYSSVFWFEAKDANSYARLGSKARCDHDVHGCPACPHSVVGPVITGSPDFMLDGRPIARVGDAGTHAACCGPNTFTVAGGDPEIVINGKAVARLGDATKHCGGMGRFVEI